MADSSGMFSSFFSLAGAGFTAASDVMGGYAKADQLKAQQIGLLGQAQGQEWSAEKAELAAQYGTLKAVQTGEQMTRNLNETLGNIDTIRAAAHTDPSSPTGAAVREREEFLGTEQRTISVNSIMAQVAQDQADAAYYRQAATTSLLGAQQVGSAAGRAVTTGYIQAGAAIFKALA